MSRLTSFASGKSGLSGWESLMLATVSVEAAGACAVLPSDVARAVGARAELARAGVAREGVDRWRGAGSASLLLALTGAACSRTTSVAFLSSRKPWNDGWRSAPSLL